MSSRRTVRQILVAVLLGVLVGGGLMAVTPAGAEVSQAAATSWKKIWKKNLRPQADKRYYTKKKSNARYQPKGSYETAGSGYTKAETYSKAEIDAKLAPLVNSVAATAGGDQSVSVAGPAQTIRSVSILPPANGMVIVTSSAYVYQSAAGYARCSQSLTSAVDGDSSAYVDGPVGNFESFALTRGYAVTKGSLLTVNLVCEGSGSPSVRDSNLTAIFAPG